MTAHAPRPTEYRGILFDSKSEAQFARFLELRHEDTASSFSCDGEQFIANTFGNMLGGFTYHPELFRQGDYVPDFLRWHVACGETGMVAINYELIECKPSEPTKVYIKEFFGRSDFFFEKAKLLYGERGADRLTVSIYFGNSWNESRGRYMKSISNRITEDRWDWLQPFEERVCSFRYDLEGVK